MRLVTHLLSFSYIELFFDMCTSPLWIRNPRYYRKDRATDYAASQLAQAPWDVARLSLQVPCGQCEECLRALRNDWYVRLRRELARCHDERKEAWFLTVTIRPELYQQALQDPSWFMRQWFEKIRHTVGYSVKHAFFQEFGTNPITGSEPRLHFHGFLFDPKMTYNRLRQIVSQFGYVWITKASNKRARYVVKYVVKHLDTSGYDISDTLRVRLSDRRYSRKFISPGLGDYLGSLPRPSYTIRTWTFGASLSGGGYLYRIPRYFDRYLSEEDKQNRAYASSLLYADLVGSGVVKHLLGQLASAFSVVSASLADSKGYARQLRLYIEKGLAVNKPILPEIPEQFLGVLQFWRDAFDLDVPDNFFKHKMLRIYG